MQNVGISKFSSFFLFFGIWDGSVTLNAGYRWFDTAEAKFNYDSYLPSTCNVEDDFSDHQIRVGLNFNF